MSETSISNCPACHAALPNSFHRRLNKLWRGVSSAACPACEASLEYGGDLRAKLHRAGLVFRAGLIVLVVALALRTGAAIEGLPFNLMIGLSFVLFVVGVFMSATKPDEIEVVRSEHGD